MIKEKNVIPLQKNMEKREEIINLAGQIINGIMSSDSSIFSKIVDRTSFDFAPKLAVDMACEMINEIDKNLEK